MIRNMIIPGQVEKSYTVANIDQTSINRIPISMFKNAAGSMTLNVIDYGKVNFVLNISRMQNAAASIFMKFVDVNI